MKRVSTFVAASVLSLLAAGPVLAAAPTNDVFGGREVVTALPFSVTVDTADATSDSNDAELHEQCGAPAMDASVWYEYTAPADGWIVLDATGSTYSVGLLVATGEPGAFGVQGCGPEGLLFFAAAGVTYHLLAFDYQGDGVGNGGTLVLSIEAGGGPPAIDLTVDPVGSFNARTGAATITGTVTCSGGEGEGEGKSFIGVQLSQLVGRFRIAGEGGTEFACDGASHAWSAEILSSAGKFGGGRAFVSASSVACNVFDCAMAEASASVTLRR
jgi:hypothetical protein